MDDKLAFAADQVSEMQAELTAKLPCGKKKKRCVDGRYSRETPGKKKWKKCKEEAASKGKLTLRK